jgi:uncharacterized RmlC-like cupin family protein
MNLDIDKLWQLYQGQTITIPPYPHGNMTDDTDSADQGNSKTAELSGFDFGVSSEFAGQNYLILPAALIGKARAVSLDGEEWTTRPVQGYAEVWYGTKSSGQLVVVIGDIEYIATIAAEADTATLRSETSKCHGRTNGDRPTWYFSKYIAEYGSPLYLTVPGYCTKLKIVHNNTRYQNGETVVKNSSSPGRKMAILLPKACPSADLTVEY